MMILSWLCINLIILAQQQCAADVDDVESTILESTILDIV